MTLQAFKAAEFETSTLRVTPVTPGKITRFEQLPLISYQFTDSTGSEQLFFDIRRKDNVGGHVSISQIHHLAKRIIDAAAEEGVTLGENSSSYHADDREFMAQTMQNLIRKAASAEPERRGDGTATIHGNGGHVHVPLPQGAMLKIFPTAEAQMQMGPYPRWDAILKGEMGWFGQRVDFAVYHAHCQGFEFDNLIGFTDQCQNALIQAFPWLEGQVCFDRIGVVTNPVSHQAKESRNG